MDNALGAYEERTSQVWIDAQDHEALDLKVDDDRLAKLVIDSLEADIEHWNKAPWKLSETDSTNISFLLGDQWEQRTLFSKQDNHEVDNRLFSSSRAILSYATAQLTKPELSPSRSDDQYVRMARRMGMALYQHSIDEKADQKVRAAVLNLLARKRGYLKLRFDPNAGTYGDIVTEVADPADIIVDRYAGYMANPNKQTQRIRCTLDELCSRFPKKANQIYQTFGVKQGRFSQLSKFITYYECWFTYYDDKRVPREGVCWFLHDPAPLILDKMQNPNWIYTGDDANDKQTNVLFAPPKPFVAFNYLNLGMSYIDETCLFEQARPQQILLNKRQKQWHDAIDYATGRYIASKRAMSEEMATKMVNKGPKTIGLVDVEDVSKAFANIGANAPAPQIYESIMDLRNEIDTMMGTPSVFRGAQPDRADTLGRDMMVKQQAGMLQDDLVRAVQLGMVDYYAKKLQMMRVYYTDDYWFQVKGGDGKYDFILMNSDNIDANVKISVQVDSNLPLDKAQIRATAEGLLRANKIDYLTAMEDMGMPDPDIRTERFMKSQMQPYVYMQSVEKAMDNSEAELDIMLVVAGKEPQERDDYDADYLDYYNHFMTTNRFRMLPPDVQQRLVSHLAIVQELAAQTSELQGASGMLDQSGMMDQPPFYPPKVQVRLQGQVDPNAAASMAAGQLPAAPAPTAPTTGQAQPAPQQPPQAPVNK